MIETLAQKVRVVQRWDPISLDALDLVLGNVFAFYQSNLEDPVPLLIGTVDERGLYGGPAQNQSDLVLYRDSKPHTSEPAERRMLDARNIIRIEPFTGRVLHQGDFTFANHYTVEFAWIGENAMVGALSEIPLRDTDIANHAATIRDYCKTFAGR